MLVTGRKLGLRVLCWCNTLAGGVGKRGTIGPGPIGQGLSSYPQLKRNRRPARGRAACELPNAFPSIGTRATYRQLRPARYPQTRAVADKKRHPARRTWATQGFPITLTRRQRGRETQRCRRRASRRRTHCECTPDARLSTMAMAPATIPLKLAPTSKEETPAGVDGGRLPAGA
jgi:hypothetical protein